MFFFNIQLHFDPGAEMKNIGRLSGAYCISSELTQFCRTDPHDHVCLTDRVGRFNFEAMINLDKTAANRENLDGVRRVAARTWAFSRWHSRGEALSFSLSLSLARRLSRFISHSAVLGVAGIFEGRGDGGGSDASYVGAIKRASKEVAEKSGGVRDWRHSTWRQAGPCRELEGATLIELQLRPIALLSVFLRERVLRSQFAK